MDRKRLTPKQEKEGGHATPPKGYPTDSSKYADPSNHKYPIDTRTRVVAAWDYIHVAKNRSMYSAAELASIERRIRAAAKKFGIELSE